MPEVFGSFGEHEKLELRFHDVIEDGLDDVAPQAHDVARLLAFGRRENLQPQVISAGKLVQERLAAKPDAVARAMG